MRGWPSQRRAASRSATRSPFPTSSRCRLICSMATRSALHQGLPDCGARGFEARDGRRHIRYLVPPRGVGHADWDFLQLVEHVELSNDQGIDAVEHAGIARQRDIEPAATARAAGHGAEFITALPDLV